MVEEQHLSLERQEYITSNTSEDGICRRQRQWMGLQFATAQ